MDLARKETYDQRCDFCKMPVMLHKMACTRRDEINAFEYDQINKQWEMFLDRMRGIRMWMADKEEKEKGQKDVLNGQNEMLKQMEHANKMIVQAIKGNENRTAKIMKARKVLSWTKQMTSENPASVDGAK